MTDQQKFEVLMDAVHRLGDDRARLQISQNALEKIAGINGMILGNALDRIEVLQKEQDRMQREMNHLRRTCYRGFKTGTAGHFLKDELWDPPV